MPVERQEAIQEYCPRADAADEQLNTYLTGGRDKAFAHAALIDATLSVASMLHAIEVRLASIEDAYRDVNGLEP